MNRTYFFMMFTALLLFSTNYIHASNDGTPKSVKTFKTESASHKMPFICPFATQAEFNLWTVIDGNGDKKTWAEDLTAKAAKYFYSSSNAGDDWLISPPLSLKAETEYRLRFDVKAHNANSTESMKVFMGQGATSADQITGELADYPTINSTTYSTKTISIRPSVTGDYNIGFYVYSAKNKYYLYVQNVIIENMSAPAAVSELAVTPTSGGLKSANITFKAPTLTIGGLALTSISKIEIFRNETPIKQFDAPAVGSSLTYTDELTESISGTYNYKVVVTNSADDGVAATASVFIGEDVPQAPTNIVVEKSGYNAVLNWTAPTKGTNGGWINEETLIYKIIRNPDNIIVSENVIGNTYTDSNIAEYSTYTYSVQSITSAGNGGIGTSTPIIVGNPFTIPYTCNFDDASTFGLWTIIDANNDNTTWKNIYSTASYSWSKEKDADDWLISPPIHLKVGRYKLSYDYRATNVSTPEKIEVFYGKGATIIDQRYSVKDYGIGITNTTLLRDIVPVIITEEGDYNFSYHVYSPKNSNSVQIDNLQIENLFDKDLMALSVKGNPYPKANKECQYIVAIKNNGALAQSSYSVQLVDNEDNILTTQAFTEEILPNLTNTVAVKYTPTTEGVMQIRCKTILDGDEESSNDISTANMVIEVQPADGDDTIIIGDGIEEDKTIPINFYYKSGISQTIYLADEMEIENGQIKKIIYPYNNVNNKAYERSLKIHMANTTLTDLSMGWIAQEQFTQVYDGNVQVDAGTGRIMITLDTPFVYTGQNICIMNTCPLESTTLNNVKFYITNTTEARSRIYANDSKVFDGTQAGTAATKYPQIMLRIDMSNAGQIEGMVQCNDMPIDGVKVILDPTGLIATTDETGTYTFKFVPAGEYSLTATKLGYTDGINPTISVVEYETTTCNMDIQQLPQYKISGTVKNIDGINIEGATIMINGYEKHLSTTDENGNFTISNIYKANGYKISVSKQGLMSYNETLDVVDTDIFINITLQDVLDKPYGVVATSTDEESIITWNKAVPRVNFRYDDGVIISGVGLNNGTDKTILGSVHRTPAIIDSVKWYTLGGYTQGGPHKTVNVFVIDLNSDGQPNSTVLFSQMKVENIDDKWNTFVFPQPIVCPRGFMIAIGYAGFLGLGHDAGNSTEWPFIADGNYFSGDYTTGEYVALSGENKFNLAIRADGIETSDSKNASKNYSKSIQGYKVWRLLESNQSTEDQWELLTDAAINTLTYTDKSWKIANQGIYKYAIKAAYTGGNLSSPVFSNIVLKGMETDVTVSVATDNSPNESEGATVTLTNIDDDNAHIYTGTVNETGKTIIENVWKGTYNVVIRHHGYSSVEIKNVEITTDNPSLSYEISEKIIAPYNLKIEEAQLSSERIFSWVASASIIEGFEDHKDFTVNSPGLTNWSYIDVDGKETYSFTRYNFPNAGAPMAAIVLNPFTTTPPMENATTTVHSGNKVLAFFCPKTSINNDWLISPKLLFPSDFTYSFWAKGYSEGFFKERIKIMYSTTGNAQADFTKTVTPTPTITTNDWVKYSYEIPATAKYVALNCVSDNQYVLLVDDIFIGIEPVTRSLQKYDVYLDGVKVDETTGSSYKFTDLKDGNHTAGVKAVYGSMTTEMTTIPFSVTISTYTITATAGENGAITPSGEIKVIESRSQKYTMMADENYIIDDVSVDGKSIGNKAEYTFENVVSNHTIKVTFKKSDGVESINSLSITMYPNPVKDILNIKGEYKSLEIFNSEGKLLITANGEAAINVSNLTDGVYIIKVYDDNKVGTYKMIK